MKKIIFLLAAGVCGLAVAQTNLPVKHPAPPAAAKAKPHPPTAINSDSADFDLNIHQAIYRGHVLVVDPQVRMTCAWMLVDLPASGEHLNHVVAATNVVIDFVDQKGQTNHVTAAKAVYDYKVVNAVTNETVTFTGKPVVEMPTMTIYSEPLVWDRAANKYHFTEPRMISHEMPGSTNGAAKLF
jgi:lipopolysaccharide export system protein LptA